MKRQTSNSNKTIHFTKWKTQAGNITTNQKVKVDPCLPEISATKIMTSEWHAGDSTKISYGVILVRYILT